MKKLTFLIVALISIPIFAQQDRAWNSLNLKNIDITQKWESFGISEAQFEAIKDEAYANPNFLEGNIYQDDQVLASKVPMRYNASSDEIEIKNSNSVGALRKDPSIYVKIFKDLYILIPYEGSNEKGGYFNILVDGKNYDLYKKTKAVFREGRIARTSYEKDTPPSFVKDVTYYLVQNGKFYELPNSKSKILKVMDKKKKEVKSYMSQNNLDLDKEADLAKLVTYFDSIL